ncbi:hypothetical protein BC939DRAFT_461149 [Gamsiella multidivaricata]|uniref:uncharacterized protein n=1 Tax=Gamsiella multidivaricata TaxID=101098 RepID=UPI00221FB122|nr:uncharacterized protein BC939DRAFT_461149 [Gamsiella multidivaricata]KAI7819101.1 hypothetical protein BC939DRAFT_461149 [Gamsiella multidivaricata]
MVAPWILFLIVGILLQSLGLFCYYMSERQRKAFTAATAASPALGLILPISAPTETLPTYAVVIAVPPPPTYVAADLSTLPHHLQEPSTLSSSSSPSVVPCDGTVATAAAAAAAAAATTAVDGTREELGVNNPTEASMTRSPPSYSTLIMSP